MHRTFLTLTILLSLLSIYGFTSLQQITETNIVILNRNHQPTSKITDGDTLKLQITLSQPAAQQENITFKLSDQTSSVGSCAIANGGTTCTTESFSALGWHWNVNGVAQNTRTVQAFKDDGELIGGSKPVLVSPRPVVMVHGFLSNPETWAPYVGSNGYLASLGIAGFAVGDGQVPGKLNTGEMLNPAGRTNTIAQNAEILGQYISGVKQKTGAEMVDLVVHSMGGMISRYYIDRIMQDRDVAQLIMLGSPMGGSDCAVLPAALGFFLPASIEIRQSYMTGVFNQQITHRRGIEFYDLGGTAINDAFKSPCTDVPNDTVVSFGSVNAITLQASQVQDIHSDLTFSQQAFQDFVKPLLQKPAGMFPLRGQPDPAPVTHTESPLEFTRVYTGHVDSGGSTELTINIEAGLSVASFALYDASRSINTIVRGASGNVIELSPETNGFIKIVDPSSLFYLGYGFRNPNPGPWQITVQATETTPANGTEFAISVYFVGGAKLEATSNSLVPQLKEQVEFNAHLTSNGQPLEIKEAKALIRDSDGNIETLNFPAGQNVSAAWTPTKAGTYAVDIIVTGVAPDGSSIERTDFLAVEVQPNPSKGRIAFNLVAVIAIVLFVLSVILFAIFRSAGKLVRRVRN
jgi:pimeloyl-ACP methyl ester carboxylesterase